MSKIHSAGDASAAATLSGYEQPGQGAVSPALEAFARTYDSGNPQVVFTRLVADLETPVSAYLKLADRRPMSFLLESVEGGATRGRYSVIGLAPDVIWRAHGATAEINRNTERDTQTFTPESAPALASLRALLAESAVALPEGLPPMAAGVFGYMGYDTVRQIERLPEMTPDALGVPDAIMIRPTLMAIFDSVKDEMTIATPVRPAARRLEAIAYPRRAARRASPPRDRGAARYARPSGACVQHERGRVSRHGGPCEGIHQGRGHLSGGAVAALFRALQPPLLCTLPRPAPAQSLALSISPRLRRFLACGILAGNPRSRA